MSEHLSPEEDEALRARLDAWLPANTLSLRIRVNGGVWSPGKAELMAKVGPGRKGRRISELGFGSMGTGLGVVSWAVDKRRAGLRVRIEEQQPVPKNDGAHSGKGASAAREELGEALDWAQAYAATRDLVLTLIEVQDIGAHFDYKVRGVDCLAHFAVREEEATASKKDDFAAHELTVLLASFTDEESRAACLAWGKERTEGAR